jgi:adenosylcobinamide hydrolase
VRLTDWVEPGGVRRPVLVCRFEPGWRAVSTAIVGGGIGPRDWWLNAQVSKEYFHPDPVAHAVQIAGSLGLRGDAGVAMLTAADVARFTTSEDGAVRVVATVGLGLPVMAAASPEPVDRQADQQALSSGPGTINLLVLVPAPLSDAALVNLVLTATEAKTQALLEAGVPGTGTSSDAVCIACPAAGLGSGAGVEPYGGPRSRWGARAARAVHAAVTEGTDSWRARNP